MHQRAQLTQQSDLPLAQDLKDTLNAHTDECVGMAANMIGVNKAAIIAMLGPLPVVMFNPQIIAHQGQYQTQEGCLCLPGQRNATRYHQITVKYRDEQWHERSLALSELPAQIVQHEIDHLHGILI